MTSRSDCVIPGPPLPLVSAGDVDDIDRVVDQLAAVLRGQVVAAALDKEQLGRVVVHELLEGQEVVADVLADRGMRASAGLDGADRLGRKRLVAMQKLGVLAREDVVGHHPEAMAIA